MDRPVRDDLPPTDQMTDACANRTPTLSSVRRAPLAARWPDGTVVGLRFRRPFLAVLFWTDRARRPRPRPVSTSPLTYRRARTLYNEHCARCHGDGGVGGKGAGAATTSGPAAVDFFLSTGRMPLSSPDGGARTAHALFSTRPRSPRSWPTSIPLDVEHGTPGPGIPEVTPACATETSNCPTLSEGQQLFLMNCAQCHDASGAGGDAQPRLHRARACARRPAPR